MRRVKINEKHDSLHVVSLSEKDEERADVPFVVKPLPTTVEELQTLMLKHVSKDKTTLVVGKESATKLRVLLKRIVDYYDPLANSDVEPDQIK